MSILCVHCSSKHTSICPYIILYYPSIYWILSTSPRRRRLFFNRISDRRSSQVGAVVESAQFPSIAYVLIGIFKTAYASFKQRMPKLCTRYDKTHAHTRVQSCRASIAYSTSRIFNMSTEVGCRSVGALSKFSQENSTTFSSHFVVQQEQEQEQHMGATFISGVYLSSTFTAEFTGH